jgi:vacuolar iron transporter family protein
MGIGGFLASQAERDHFRYLRYHTAARVSRSCMGEMEREVQGVLGPLGVDQKTCRSVTKCLKDAEGEDEDEDGGRNGSADEEEGSLRWSKEMGLTAFLLKFGEGLGTYNVSSGLRRTKTNR